MGNKAEVVVLWATELTIRDLTIALSERPRKVFLLVPEQSGNVKYLEDFIDLVLTLFRDINANVTILRPHPQRLFVNDALFFDQVLRNGALTDILSENAVIIGGSLDLRQMHARAKMERMRNE